VLAADGRKGGDTHSRDFGTGEGFVEAECWMDKYAIGTEWDALSIGEQSEKYFQLIKTDPDRPSPTICSSSGNFISAACPMHPYEKRKWSIAELRRICGFPDDFILTGKFGEQWERLGNSVTPPLMKHIAARLYRDIFTKL
jgi:DNA (cytosine-5)-methyltransferase 1